MPKVLVIDNYDSFTYNLVQYLYEIGLEVTVYRNDAGKAKSLVLRERPDSVLISPGPSNPDHAGITLDMIEECAKQRLPLFGVCLGHQAIGQFFGGRVVRLEEPVHGKVGLITHNSSGVFRDLPVPFEATRYHSLVVDPATVPEKLEVTATLVDKDVIMGLKHRELPIEGVQFHPESILTSHGQQMLRNFFC